MNLLAGFVRIVCHRECRAQRFVSPDKFTQGTRERGNVDHTPEVPAFVDVVGGRGPFELIQKPQSFLGKRQGQWFVAIGLGYDRRFALCRGWSCRQSLEQLQQLRFVRDDLRADFRSQRAGLGEKAQLAVFGLKPDLLLLKIGKKVGR